MDSKKKGQKLNARKSCNNNNARRPHQFTDNLVLQLLIALTCSFVSSYNSFWFPSLSSLTLNQFMLIPSTMSPLIMNPKFLFIVMNIIVIILIAESRLRESLSPSTDIYDEYVKRSRSLQRRRTASMNNGLRTKVVEKVKEEKIEVKLLAVEEKREEESEEEANKVEVANDNNNGELGDGERDHEDQGDDGLATEELNKRVGNFIARVNRKRLLEARSAMHEDMVDFPAKSFGRSIVVHGSGCLINY